MFMLNSNSLASEAATHNHTHFSRSRESDTALNVRSDPSTRGSLMIQYDWKNMNNKGWWGGERKMQQRDNYSWRFCPVE